MGTKWVDSFTKSCGFKRELKAKGNISLACAVNILKKAIIQGDSLRLKTLGL
jgi:hypothetical protein